MRRTPIRFAEIPPNFINALLSAEDDNFANHYGVDPSSLMRAATQLVKAAIFSQAAVPSPCRSRKTSS